VDIDLTSDQELLRDASVRFIQENCPLGTVRQLAEGETGIEADYLRQAAELGWFAMLVPESLGGGDGSGLGLQDATVIAEERGRFLQPGPFVPTNIVADALVRAGSEEQRAKVVPALVAGELLATWLIADPSGGWDAGAAIRCEPKGRQFVLDGVALLAQDAALADLLLVTARSARGITQFLMPSSTPGTTIEPMESLDITRRFFRVRLDGVELGESALVGPVEGSAALVERQLSVAITLTLAEMIGAMSQDFETVLEYAKARTAFGRPIGSFQAVKHQLADTSLLLEASKATAVAVAKAVQNDGPDAAEVASIGKAFVSDCAVDLAQACWQVYGGIGYTWEHDQHLYLRRLTTDALLYGDAAWHRERICTIHEL
jgi:alkylation response protein AidB-like acyl-CoA dehydrogenase